MKRKVVKNHYKSYRESWAKDKTPQNDVLVRRRQDLKVRGNKVKVAEMSRKQLLGVIKEQKKTIKQIQAPVVAKGNPVSRVKKIVLHHTAFEKKPRETDEKVLQRINREHKKYFDNWNQPLSGTQYPYIAYHKVTIGSKTYTTRLDHIVGYHAGNIKVNKEGLGHALHGNFKLRKTNFGERKAYFDAINKAKALHKVKEIGTHNDWRKKRGTDCCGKYLLPEVRKRYLKPKSAIR